MEDAGLVRAAERVRDLIEEVERFGESERSPAQARGEVLALKAVHHEVRDAVLGHVEVVHRDDARVAEAGERFGFAPEPLQRGGFERSVRQEHFDRVEPPGAHVLAFVDRTDAARAHPLADPVAPEQAADDRTVLAVSLGIQETESLPRSVTGARPARSRS